MTLSTPIDRFINIFKRPGFFLYIGLVLGSLGWTFWEMHAISKRLEQEKKRQGKK